MRARAVEVGEPPSDPTTADDAYAVHLAALEAELQEMISEERAARLYADAAAPPLARSR